jgi:hypothetical protein
MSTTLQSPRKNPKPCYFMMMHFQYLYFCTCSVRQSSRDTYLWGRAWSKEECIALHSFELCSYLFSMKYAYTAFLPTLLYAVFVVLDGKGCIARAVWDHYPFPLQLGPWPSKVWNSVRSVRTKRGERDKNRKWELRSPVGGNRTLIHVHVIIYADAVFDRYFLACGWFQNVTVLFARFLLMHGFTVYLNISHCCLI